MSNASVDFLVQRKDLRACKFADAPAPGPLQQGQVLLKVDRFAFTANNITYAVFGEAMHYWDFFPAPAGWGRVPVWGFAQVAQSKHPSISEGERVYGYLPMSTHLVVQPERISPSHFMDASAHRKPLPAAYQRYSRCAGDPAYRLEHEDQQAILWPLYYTSFLIEDFLAANKLFGAEQVVIASASSKTALGAAFLLKRRGGRSHFNTASGTGARRGGCKVIGLTSQRNHAFCQGVGYYDQVVAYDALNALDVKVPTVFVDIAGDGELLHTVHHHFRDSLKHSCIVGATHWEARRTQHQLPGAQPQFFFAPTQVTQRRKDWGAEGLERRFAEAWQAFLPSVNAWLKVVNGRDPAAVEAAYREVLDGKGKPEQGHMLTL